MEGLVHTCSVLVWCCPCPSLSSSQVEFVSHLLSLLKTHLGLVAPLGVSCVQVACGQQVRPIRNLLLQLIDSQLPTKLDKASIKDFFVINKAIFQFTGTVRLFWTMYRTLVIMIPIGYFDNQLQIASPLRPSFSLSHSLHHLFLFSPSLTLTPLSSCCLLFFFALLSFYRPLLRCAVMPWRSALVFWFLLSWTGWSCCTVYFQTVLKTWPLSHTAKWMIATCFIIARCLNSVSNHFVHLE